MAQATNGETAVETHGAHDDALPGETHADETLDEISEI
jgi:hypothetical protein